MQILPQLRTFQKVKGQYPSVDVQKMQRHDAPSGDCMEEPYTRTAWHVYFKPLPQMPFHIWT